MSRDSILVNMNQQPSKLLLQQWLVCKVQTKWPVEVSCVTTIRADANRDGSFFSDPISSHCFSSIFPRPLCSCQSESIAFIMAGWMKSKTETVEIIIRLDRKREEEGKTQKYMESNAGFLVLQVNQARERNQKGGTSISRQHWAPTAPSLGFMDRLGLWSPISYFCFTE